MILQTILPLFLGLVLSTITVPDRPPKDITAISIGTDTVQVDWSPVPPEYTNGEVLGYKVLYSDVNDNSRVNRGLVSTNETHSKIKGLKANTNYSFQVLAFTATGDGPWSIAYFARTFSAYELSCSDCAQMMSFCYCYFINDCEELRCSSTGSCSESNCVQFTSRED